MTSLAQTNPYLVRPTPSRHGLADILNSTLDKGLVIGVA